MKKEFSFYEFVGVIAPGSVFLIILVYLFPDSLKALEVKQLSVGGLGVFIIIAYVFGHLIQTIGNLLEIVYWKLWGGIPSFWITKGDRCDYLSAEQIQSIPTKIATSLKMEIKMPLSNFNNKQWIAINRQIYAAIKQADATERLDIFNGNYGLFRGVASSFVIGLIVMTIKSGFSHYEYQLLIAVCFILAIIRMHRFAIHYARELFVQFLQLK